MPTAPEVGLTPKPGNRIVFLERPGCHLCEDALVIVQQVATEFSETIERKNIADDDSLARRWSIEIPVIAVDGEVVNVYRADAAALKKALRKRRR